MNKLIINFYLQNNPDVYEYLVKRFEEKYKEEFNCIEVGTEYMDAKCNDYLGTSIWPEKDLVDIIIKIENRINLFFIQNNKIYLSKNDNAIGKLIVKDSTKNYDEIFNKLNERIKLWF